jgi:hypothetical protein
MWSVHEWCNGSFFLQEHEINPELQIENNWNLESEKKNEKKTLKIWILKEQFGSHMVEILYVWFFCEW